MEPGDAPGIASFSSKQPDWTLPVQLETPPWTERWGRKALGWTMGLAAAVALVSTGAWVYRDTQVASTLAVVADHTTAASGVAQGPLPPAAPVVAEPEPEPQALPPLKLLPPEAVAAAPAEEPGTSAATAATGAPLAAAAAAVPASPTQAGPAPRAIEAPPARAAVRPADGAAGRAADRAPAKAATKPASARRVAAAPVKRSRTEVDRPAPKPVRERELARAATPPARSAKAARPVTPETPAPPVASPLEETLRLCRAAGYHATACLKRGCEATRYGLACRG